MDNTQKQMTPVSVVMAAYNGEEFISRQISSILRQLSMEDELIISLDPSQDRTMDIITGFQDPRIHVFKGPGRGVVKNFENGLRQAKNPIIFLSDQDDIWLDHKKETVVKAFEQDPELLLAVHDCQVCDETEAVIEPSFYAIKDSGPGYNKNLAKNTYIGCCMAFRKDLLQDILPMDENLPMHDWYIGLTAEKCGKVVFLPDVLMKYRRHTGNATKMKPAGVMQQAKWRMQMMKALKGKGR